MIYHLIWPCVVWIGLCHDLVSSFGVSSPTTTIPSFTPRQWGRNNGHARVVTVRMASVQSSADDVSIIQSSSADTLVSLGKVAYSKGELDEARELWEAAIECDASNPAAHYQLGLLAKRQSYLSEACAFFRHAIDVNHVQSDDKDDANNIKNDDIQYELGVVLVQMGYIPEADAIFRDIVSREPSVDRPSKVKLALANLMLDGRGKRSEALQVYAQACRAGSSPMAFLAGVTADSMGDHSAALEFYQTSYDASPDDEDTALHLMVAHLREGNHAAAATLRSRLASHALSSLDYVLSTPVGMDPSMQFFTYDMIHLALKNTRELTTEGGLVLEFGVYHGKTLRMIASHFPNIVHGFDTFSGIPEDWHSFTPKNSYSTHGTLPQVPENVQFHVGLFSDTLPGFLENHPDEPIRFMNIDCDLYSSTKDVFDAVHDRVVPGTIIIFDEYIMNPHWKQDEYKAFQEAAANHGWKYKYLGISLVSQQAVVQIIA